MIKNIIETLAVFILSLVTFTILNALLDSPELVSTLDLYKICIFSLGYFTALWIGEDKQKDIDNEVNQ